MCKPEEWVGSARLVHAFYTDEVQMIGLFAPALRVGLLGLIHPRGYRRGGAAIRRKINT